MGKRDPRMWSKEDVARQLDEHNRQVRKRVEKQWRRETRQQYRRKLWRSFKARFWGRW